MVETTCGIAWLQRVCCAGVFCLRFAGRCLLLSQKRPKGVRVKVAPEIKAFRDKLKQSKVNVRKWVEEVSARAVAVAAGEHEYSPCGWQLSAPCLAVAFGLRRPTTMAAAL